MKTVAAVVALSVLTAGCSGGSESSEPAVEKAKAETPVDTGPPTADEVATLDGVTYASLTGDAASGKSSFNQCRACHVIDPGMNRLGPSLANIVGRKAGSVAGFNYSDANANSGITWTEEKLFQFLEKPARVIPKTKMFYAGMPDPQARANLIAYLKNPS
ncbi:c-type cytochrome [Parasphingorhabdus sp.]|uniref:c-type cytochrome n=1 Tax=Parasphingorhabdus sp. TaxID=2709688 RepID=UPI003A908E77